MISIYLYKKDSIHFQQMILFNYNYIQFLFSRKLFAIILSKEFWYKISIWQQNLFLFAFIKKWMNFYNFIYKNISIYFHLRKVIYTNYFKIYI